MKKIPLIMIDDESFYLDFFNDMMSDEYDFFGADNLDAGIQLIKKQKPEVLLLDIALANDTEGVDRLPELCRMFPALPIIMVTNTDSHLLAQESLKKGASDYFVKSENIKELHLMIQSLLIAPPVVKGGQGKPIALSLEMRNILQKAKRFAKSSADVLLTGETGVGKEVVARYIHQNSDRSGGPFIAVNCGAIPHDLFESELFGHEKGAFTNAHTSRTGKFEAAQNGTIFLDEIGELPLPDQAKLLRVIDQKVIQRIGSNTEISLDIRIIAATNAPLPEMMNSGKFRKDLYYRLRQFSLHIPPLREREEDIIPLANHFLAEAVEKHHTRSKRFLRNTLLTLKNHYWEGNVRDLRMVVESSAISSPGKDISAAHLNLVDVGLINASRFKTAKKEFERDFIKNALAKNRGNVTATARDIGLTRQGLQKKMNEFGLDLTDGEAAGL